LVSLGILFGFDTLVTVWALANGAAEANPLYWAFHDLHQGWQAVADAVGVRVTVAVAVFYWLHQRARLPLLRVIVGGYFVLMVLMASAHLFAHLTNAELRALVGAIKLIASGYAIAALIVLMAIIVALARVLLKLRRR